MIRELSDDARQAFRTLVKRPSFTLFVVLILALGIGANVAMFHVLHATLIRPLPLPEPERLVLGRCTVHGHINPWVSSMDYFDYRDQSTAFERLAATLGFPLNTTVTGGGEPERARALFVSVDFFPTLGIRPHTGRQFRPDEGKDGAPPVAIVSYGFWQRRLGGSPSAIGKPVILDGDPCTVVGVLPASFHFRAPCDIYVPMQPNGPYAGARRFHNWLLVGRLKSGISVSAAQSQMDTISSRLEREYPDSNKNKALLLTPLQEALTENSRLGILLLMAANAAVLLIACANVAGILLARGSVRRSELAIRSALGASRVQLVRQLLAESFMMAAAAGIAGVGLSFWLQRMMFRYLPLDLPSTGAAPPLGGTLLLFSLGVTFAAGLLSGIAPALRSSRVSAAQDLTAGGRTAGASHGSRLRSGLVVVQVAVTVVLLICSTLLIRSFGRLVGVDPGFEPGHLLTAEVRLPAEYGTPERRIQFFTALREKILAIPGVKSAGMINQLPILNPGNNLQVHDADNPPVDLATRGTAYQRVVFPGYFEAMGIPLIAGRDIRESDGGSDPPVVVISRDMAEQLFPNRNPLGKRIVIDNRQAPLEVVGVVGPVHTDSLARDPRWTLYGSYRQRALTTMRLALRTQGEPASVSGALRQAVRDLDRNIPLTEMATMETVISRSVADSRALAALLFLFAAAALILAGMGIYGVLAWHVNLRRREIGLHMALGACPARILRLTVLRGMALSAAGLVLGLGGSMAATRLLEGALFHIEPADGLTFAGASAFFAMIALGACLMPAWRAMRVDPSVALRNE